MNLEDKINEVEQVAAKVINPAAIGDAWSVIQDLAALIATPEGQKLLVDLAKLGTDFAASAPAAKVVTHELPEEAEKPKEE